MTSDISLAPLLEHFFTRRLMHQRQASPHTIRSYRDTFRQFLIFAQQRLHQPPSHLTFEQIDAPLIVGAFLEDLEKYRRCNRSQSQFAPHRDSFVLSLRGVRVANTFSSDSESAGNSEQALHPQTGQLPQP